MRLFVDRIALNRLALVATLLSACLVLEIQAAGDIRVADQQLFARLDSDGDGLVTATELPQEQSRLFARLVRLGDSNGDGHLTEAEWQVALEPTRPEKPIEEKRSSELPGADAARLLLLKLDADGDSVLTKQEAPERLRGALNQIVDQYDRNKDDQIDRMELARGGPRITRIAQQTSRRLKWDVHRELSKLDRQQGDAAMRFSERPRPEQVLGDPKQALALFKQFDQNGDGQVERDEIPEQVADRFNRLFRVGDRNGDNALSQREFLTASKRAAKFLQRMSAANNQPD